MHGFPGVQGVSGTIVVPPIVPPSMGDSTELGESSPLSRSSMWISFSCR